MKNYAIAEQFAVISNTWDSLHESVAKNVAVAELRRQRQCRPSYRRRIEPPVFEQKLQEQPTALKMKQKEQEPAHWRRFTDILKAEGILKEIPNLLGCDMNYYTANVTMRGNIKVILHSINP